MTKTATTAKMTPALVGSIRWTDGGQVYSFTNGRRWGVTDGAGRWVTFGTDPWTTTRRQIAEMVCEGNAADYNWIEAL